MSWPGRFWLGARSSVAHAALLNSSNLAKPRTHPLGTTSLVASSVAAVVGVAYIVATPSNCQLPTQTFLNFLRHKKPHTTQNHKTLAEGTVDGRIKGVRRAADRAPTTKADEVFQPKERLGSPYRAISASDPAAYSIEDRSEIDAPHGRRS